MRFPLQHNGYGYEAMVTDSPTGHAAAKRSNTAPVGQAVTTGGARSLPLSGPLGNPRTVNFGLAEGFLSRAQTDVSFERRQEMDESPHALRKSQRSKTILNLTLGLEDDGRNGWFKRFVILPGSATGRFWLEGWDLSIVLLLLFVAYYEPFVMALFRPGNQPLWMIIVDGALTCIFTLDMLLQFIIAFPHAQDSCHKDLWQRNVAVIAAQYTSCPGSDGGRGGWFWLDLFSVAPGWVWFASWWLGSDTFANPFLMLRIVRLFFLARLQRLSTVHDKLQAKMGFPLFVVEVGKFIIITTIACHWMACVWVMFEGRIMHGALSYHTEDTTWLSALLDSKGDSCHPSAAEDPMCVFMLAYYWATMTLTSVGYGDITPQNRMEYFISVICMFVVGYTWAFIVGKIVSILSTFDPNASEFDRSIDELGQFMRRRGLSTELQVKLRTYMHETRHFYEINRQRDLIQRYFSDGLQREVAKNSAEVREMLKSVFWMRELQEDAILDIVRGLMPKAYGPQELINVRGCMVVLQRGLVGVRGRVIGRGDVWGQNDILMETQQLIDGAMPMTLSFVELLLLHRRTLVEVGRNYPDADRRLRRAQVRTAVSRAFVYQAHRIQRQRSRAQPVNLLSAAPPSESREEPCKKTRKTPASLMERAATSIGSSFANPGLKRVHDLFEATKHKPDWHQDLEQVARMTREVLERQEMLACQVEDLANEVRSKQAVGLGGTMKAKISHAKRAWNMGRFSSSLSPRRSSGGQDDARTRSPPGADDRQPTLAEYERTFSSSDGASVGREVSP
uniref:Ion transport domain-containing protein n=1 Tax=Zooxanthella nutricula TaxID=1333877 RepID=A0A6U6JAC8_9DINO|mmetsp:Transcript_22489/g.67398  ORF Transcript_22489/g.67398 Transcript_22489/m.67398 type:complete len:790 (+) Transcript_22489:117-2486(+)